MKKTFLTLLVALFSMVVVAQIPKEAFDLSNSLYDLWKTSPKEKAVEVSVKLNKLYQPFLIDDVHHNLAQLLCKDKSKAFAQEYLQAMMDLKDPSIRAIFEPIYVWNQSFSISTIKEAEGLLQNYYTLLKDSSDIKAKTELYGLLILKTLENKNLQPFQLQIKVLDKIISNLQKYPYLDQPEASKVSPRAWHRYLLAYSMFLKFRTQGESFDCLQAAAKYSPDLMDMQRRDAYYYDANLLEGNNSQVGYQPQLIQYLDKSKRYKDALNVMLESTFTIPLNANLQQLKDFLQKHTELGDFKKLWPNYVDSKMKPAPALQVVYESEVLDFTKPRKHWTFIDVWGTWCSPCVKELPHLNEVAAKYNSLPESKIRIRTFSYMSSQLKDFLSKNNYTFPVAEVGQEVAQPFGINSYPTKLLVSPDNKYLIIPFNTDWEQYMRNYTLFE